MKKANANSDDRFAPLLKDAKFRAPPPKSSSNRPVASSSSSSKSSSSNSKPSSSSSNKRRASSSSSSKEVVDDRFASMFHAEEFQSKPVLDRYGRQQAGKGKSSSSSSKDITKRFALGKQDESRLEQLNQLARGAASDDDDEDEEPEAYSSDSEDEDEDDGPSPEVTFDSDAITKLEMSTHSSHRLACLGCDWDRMRAVDLLAILNSFVPAVGAILRVSVYPTQFGQERMLMEDENGPLAHTAAPLPEDDDDDEDDEDDMSDTADGDAGLLGGEYNPELLRKYEKERLLYYVAVVECDSQATAEAVYNECDGLEVEHSSIALDLRFVPAEVQFDRTLLRDAADEVPDEYQGPEDFVNKSLQQTSVSLSWDDAKHERAKLHEWGDAASSSNKKGGGKKAQGVSLDELEAFIASSDDDSDEEKEDRAAAVQKYRALLLQPTVSSKNGGGDDDDDEEKEDMYKDVAEEEEEEYKPNVASSSSSKSKKKQQERAAVVVVNEDVAAAEARAKKSKKSKKKSKREAAAAGEDEQEVKLDVQDERLAGLFTDPEFMLDQTDPRYKATAVTKKINEERRKRLKIRD